MSAWDQMQTPYFRELYDRWKTQGPETNDEETMTDKETLDLAERYADWDDFGRWTFRNSDRLLDFVCAIQEAEREACAQLFDEVPDDDVYLGSQYAAAIRARGEK